MSITIDTIRSNNPKLQYNVKTLRGNDLAITATVYVDITDNQISEVFGAVFDNEGNSLGKFSVELVDNTTYLMILPRGVTAQLEKNSYWYELKYKDTAEFVDTLLWGKIHVLTSGTISPTNRATVNVSTAVWSRALSYIEDNVAEWLGSAIIDCDNFQSEIDRITGDWDQTIQDLAYDISTQLDSTISSEIELINQDWSNYLLQNTMTFNADIGQFGATFAGFLVDKDTAFDTSIDV
jgi:hypothetical protein